MSNSQPLIRTRSSIGDAAVDGLLHGVVAGAVMAIYIVLIGAMAGAGPAATLSAFDLGQDASPVRGALIHLAIAAIFGIGFSLIYRLIVQRRSIGQNASVIIGCVYGLFLWSIAQIAVAAGINVGLGSLPAVHLATAHVIYGVTLGWLVGRVQAE